MIDFVVLWVDGNDKNWREKRDKYAQIDEDKNIARFRDWDNLQYLFRAFEQFTPWVRKIHFVTDGHLPKWLNLSHPKLNIVKHQDYIDSKYLPVFSANPLESYLNHIDELSEQFVFFNDDFFITKEISSDRFFQQNLPCDALISNAISSSSGVGHFVLNDIEILNKYFDKKMSLKKDFTKWFNIKYGINNFRNVALLPWSRFTGFVDFHMPQPFLKSIFDEIWSLEENKLRQTMSNRFRRCSDYNQYLFRYWQLVSGKFVPVSMKDTKYLTLKSELLDSSVIEDVISLQKYSMICLNDDSSIDEKSFMQLKEKIKDSFEKILPNKSGFEL